MQEFLASIRLVIATMLVCVIAYAAAIWAIGQSLTPSSARGSLITAKDGTILGSHLIAQKFTKPEYFWPRPSAAGKDGYDATAAAGSNKSPTSPDLTSRAEEIIAVYGAAKDNPMPADLVTASGGGLDPHISENAARYQAKRVAKARGLQLSEVTAKIEEHAFKPGGFLTPGRLVNVLELNLALDQIAVKQ